MADDISKKITIEVEAQTEKLQQNITTLNEVIGHLSTAQEKLIKSGNDSSAAFQKNASAIKGYQLQVQQASKQLSSLNSVIKTAGNSAAQSKGVFDALAQTNQKLAQSITKGASQLKKFSSGVGELAKSAEQHQSATSKSKTSLDAHAQSMANVAAESVQLKKDLDNSSNSLQNQQSAATKSKKGIGDHGTSMKQSSSKSTKLKRDIDATTNSLKKQGSAAQNGQTAIASHAGSMGNGANQASNLTNAASQSAKSFQEQKQQVDASKTALDLHQATMQGLKTAFQEIEGISGLFGPSLQDAATGFNVLKNGLDIVKSGFQGVGTAIAETGFGLLVQILGELYEKFINSATGSNILHGAISAIGVIVNVVKGFFEGLKNGIIDAITHPIDSIKKLGKMIMENIINRFTAFGVILDGIIHLDFKKMADGAIQAVTGITNATEKIAEGVTKAGEGIKKVAGDMVNAYKDGYNQAGQQVSDHEAKVTESLKRLKEKYEDLKKTIAEVHSQQGDLANNPQRGEELEATGGVLSVQNDGSAPSIPELKSTIVSQQAANNEVDIKKTALQQIEDFAKQSATKIESDAFNILTQGIKQQSEAKIAALEKDKAAELNNASLTSAQRQAITAKFQQQEAQIKAKAFKEEQEASMAQAIINGAVAVTKVSAQAGLAGALEIGAVIAETAAQVAKIASQKAPAYAVGGLHYSSDGRGGVLPGYSRSDNTNAYLRSGEGIVVSEAMREPWARNLVSAINVGFGGRDFSIANPGRGYAVGGIFTDGGDANRYYNQPVHDQKNMANTIAYQMINNFPPVYVDVKDINNQQNILAQTINRVNL